jgi:hypothetical protein
VRQAYFREEALPESEEPRQILERASFVLNQARALCQSLDESEGKVSWRIENSSVSRGSAALQYSGFDASI